MAASSRLETSGLLPLPRTSLVGREQELATARALLLDEAVPLLTLTGPGGVGKTRLALAAAHDIRPAFADGAVFVDFSPLTDAELAPATVAAVLGVTNTPARSVVDAIAAHLRRKQCLLVLDNCEHVLAVGAELVAVLLNECPALQVLATSRAPLRVRGEQVVVVSPLLVPSPGANALAEIQSSSAVALFSVRARAADLHFSLTDENATAVAEVCRHLDGLPLAIELTAAQAGALAPAAMAALLRQRVPVAGAGSHGVPARHQTIREAIAWSYALLSLENQAFFRSLAVFAGGWSVEAAAAVSELQLPSAMDRIVALVDQSLIVRYPEAGSSDPRFAMLETIREFAADQLAAHDEHVAARKRHADYFVATCAAAAASWPSVGPPRAALDWMEREHPNIRAALNGLLAAGANEAVLRLCNAVGDFWFIRGYVSEGIAWFRRGLRCREAVDPRLRALALGWIATLAGRALDTAALPESEESVAILDALGDESAARAFVLLQLGVLRQVNGEYARAEALFRETAERYRLLGDRAMMVVAITDQANAARQAGALDRAALLADKALREQGEEVHPWSQAFTLMVHGDVARERGEQATALADYRQSLSTAVSYGDRVRAGDVITRFGLIAARGGDPSRAARLFGAGAAIREIAGQLEPRYLQPSYDQTLAAMQSALDGETWRGLWETGRRLTLEEAATEALALTLDSLQAASLDSEAPVPDCHRSAAEPAFDLTRREREVLKLICQRQTDTEIAAALFLSPRTASKHVGNILGKLEVSSRRDAAAIAAGHGLV